MNPGPRNLITDVAGLRVGNAEDHTIKSGTTVLVGDRHHDVEGGAVHAVPVIFVRWGFSWPHEADGAQAAVDDVAELRRLLLFEETHA